MSDEFVSMAARFRASNGQPIEYEGQTVRLAYDIPVEGRHLAHVRFIRSSGAVVHGAYLKLSGGQLRFEDVQSTAFTLFTDTAPEEVPVELVKKGRKPLSLRVWNCWRSKWDQPDAWTGNSGLVVSHESADTWLFRCSAGPGEFDLSEFEFLLTLS